MIRSLAFLALVCALAACDSVEDATEARIAFDYVPGAAPVLDGEVVFPATANAAVLVITPIDYDRPDDRYVTWEFPNVPPHTFSNPVENAFVLPLDKWFADIDGAQISVMSSRTCNPYGGPLNDPVRETRVPATAAAGTRVVLTGCQGEPRCVYVVRGTETVTVPAGTFEALVLAAEPDPFCNPRGSRDRTVEFWAGARGLVRLDLVNAAGVLRGSLVRTTQ